MKAITTHAEALHLLRMLMVATQKARSTMTESIGDSDMAQALLAETQPWLFGPRSILPKLAEQVQRAEAGAEIEGMQLFNWATLIERNVPVVLVSLGFQDPKLRGFEADMKWCGQRWAP